MAARDEPTYLDFEQPLRALDDEIARLAESRGGGGTLGRLRAERRRRQTSLVARLTPWQRVQLARHPDRPGMLEYVDRLFQDFVELHGDRRAGDDGAVVGGIGRFRGRAVVVVGHQRARTPAEEVTRNFGMPRPEGFRKAVRLFRLAERLGRPVVTFVDTPGAYPGIGAEERGQAEAIASCLATLAGLRVPVVSAVIGEGGSGGALAFALADRVIMQQHAWYAVLSPEGCASILFRERTAESVARSAELLRLTAEDLAAFGVVDEVVLEPPGGAHRHAVRAAALLGETLERHLAAIARLRVRTLPTRRYRRFRRIGAGLRADR